MKISGVGNFVLSHKDGTVERFSKHNMIMQSGFDAVCSQLLEGGDTKMLAKVGIGEGTTANDESMTALESELVKVDSAYEHVAGTKIFTVTAEFPEGVGTGAITEAGVICADDSLFDRVTFDVINKGEDDKFTASFQFTIS